MPLSENQPEFNPYSSARFQTNAGKIRPLHDRNVYSAAMRSPLTDSDTGIMIPAMHKYPVQDNRSKISGDKAQTLDSRALHYLTLRGLRPKKSTNCPDQAPPDPAANISVTDCNGRSQHYASTSVRDHPPPSRQQDLHLSASSSKQRERSHSVTTSIRPESALGQLWERFGTLRRRAHWRRGSSRAGLRAATPQSQIYAPASIAGYPMGSSASRSNSTGTPFSKTTTGTRSGTLRHIPLAQPVAPGQPLVLDAEIYASAAGGGKTAKLVTPLAEAIYAEGSYALDSNARRRLVEHELDPALMAEGETRAIIDLQSRRQPEFRQLVGTLTSWINDELASERIIVRDLADDLHDGQVLCKLTEKLQQLSLDIVEVTQNERAQRHKLQTVLGALNRVFALQARTWARIRWSVDGIHSKNLVEILHLLITMALFYRAPLRLPPNVFVTVLVFQKHQGELVRRSHQAQLTDNFVTSALEHLNPPSASESNRLAAGSSLGHEQRDAFDALIEHAPAAKLEIVKRSLVKFCNRHLNKINMSCHRLSGGEHATALNQRMSAGATAAPSDLDPHQFSDGLLLVFLIASLEDYFVPLGQLFTSVAPSTPGSHLVADHNKSPGTTPLPYIDENNNDNSMQPFDDYLASQQLPIEQPTALEPTSYVNTQPIEKLHNVNVALQLFEDAGLADIKQRVRAEEIVNGDLKAVLRVLYALFSRYKHL